MKRSLTEEEYGEVVKALCSPHYFTDLVPAPVLQHALVEFINAADRLDKIKKALFYGKMLEQVSDIPAGGDLGRVDPDIMHGVLGIITEAGELGEWLAKHIAAPLSAGAVNLVEELGDLDWYAQLLRNRLGLTDGEVRYVNAKKLFTRYPGKFEAESALVRNLAAENEVLEAEVKND